MPTADKKFGMNKRKIHHFWTKIRAFSRWYFLVGFVIFGSVFVYAYRQNNFTAISLREKLLEVDRQNGDVETALRELRTYTYAHMNAELDSGDHAIYPPIQLKYRYERLVEAEHQRVASLNRDLYNQAQAFCEQKFPQGSSGTRQPCIQEFIDSRGGSNAVKPKPIPDSLYKFNFYSPLWSPDLAGWSLFAALVMLFLFVVRVVLDLWLKRTLRSHN